MKGLPTTKFEKYRLLLLVLIGVVSIGYFSIPAVITYMDYSPEEGDIVFQSLPDSKLARAIEGATKSPYSHTGMIIKKNGSWYVREAAGPVMDTNLYLWIARGKRARFAAYRLKERYKNIIPQFIHESEKYLGLPYDIYFELDDEKIYCSELIYKSFNDATNENLGNVVMLKDLNWEFYKDFIESIEVNGIPYERKMITPANLSQASQLNKIYSNGI
jgi:hypothetical protein